MAKLTECINGVIKSNRFFLIEPATGYEMAEASIGASNVIVSPIVAFSAICSRLLGIHPAIMLRTVLPVIFVFYLFLILSIIVKTFGKNHFVICGLVVMLLSACVFFVGWKKGYETGRIVKAENYYKVSSESIAVCDAIHSNDKNSKCILPDELLSDARVYSDDLELLYGLNGRGNVVYSGFDCESVYENMQIGEPDYDLILAKALVEGCNIIVIDSSKTIDAEVLDRYGYNLLQEVAGYKIYYSDFYNWKVTQYGDNEGNQSSFYAIESPAGRLTLIDGGWDSQYETVWNVIEEYDYHIDNWIISHPHFDHVGAFNHIMSDPELRDKITIDQIYATPVNEKRDEETAQEYDVFEDYLTYKDIMSGLDNVIYVHAGEEYNVDGLKMKIINAWDENVDSLPDHLCNDGSLMFKLSSFRESMLFCSDVQSEMEQFILPNYSEEIHTDYVQCGHHGNWGLTKDFYEVVDPEVVFMDSPASLFDKRDGVYDGYILKDYFEEKGVTLYTFDGAPHTITME